MGTAKVTAMTAISLMLAAPASAIVGGVQGGPVERTTLMVLNSRGGVCSGIVIAQDVILTAAHCVPRELELRVHYKANDGAAKLIVPRTVSLHPGYDAKAINKRTRSIDLALLHLPAPLPSRFAIADLTASAPRAGMLVTVAGWGVSIEGEARSTGTYRHAGLKLIEPYGPSSILLWAADPKGDGKRTGAGVCQGDSGGPMILEGAVIAVSSWSTGAAGKTCGLLTQAIRLGPQREWIDKTLAAWGTAASWR
jgi:secreted trypsin-like serine protease